jgi:hypothetical protein
MKVKGKEYDIEIEDITDRKATGQESYSKGISNKFSKPLKNPSDSNKAKVQ